MLDRVLEKLMHKSFKLTSFEELFMRNKELVIQLDLLYVENLPVLAVKES